MSDPIPSAAKSQEFVYVGNSATLESLVRRILVAERVALDTEADSLHNYFEKVCLIQLSLGDENYLIDPLCDLDLAGFLQALAEKPLIVHGGDYDLRMLRGSLGFRPHGEVFDTMLAAQLLGIEQIGLAALIERFFAITIGKEGQKSDWSQRPLTDKQLRYAIDDTRFLAPLAERLEKELSERGRLAWHQDSCRAMVHATGRDRLRDPDDAWRIKGSARLTRRQQAYLREIWHWRDRHARRTNVPSFKVFGNQQIVDLLLWAESHTGAALREGPKLPRNMRGSLLQTLEDAVARAARMAPIEWPEPRKSEHAKTPGAEYLAQINALRGECARIAEELKIAPSIVAPRAAIEAIAVSRACTVDEIVESAGLLRWQAELLHSAVEKCRQST